MFGGERLARERRCDLDIDFLAGHGALDLKRIGERADDLFVRRQEIARHRPGQPDEGLAGFRRIGEQRRIDHFLPQIIAGEHWRARQQHFLADRAGDQLDDVMKRVQQKDRRFVAILTGLRHVRANLVTEGEAAVIGLRQR